MIDLDAIAARPHTFWRPQHGDNTLTLGVLLTREESWGLVARCRELEEKLRNLHDAVEQGVWLKTTMEQAEEVLARIAR